MKLAFPWLAILLTLGYRGGTVAAEPKAHVAREFTERDEPMRQASVPGIIQTDFYRSACKFLESVYPDIDKDWMHSECREALLKDRYSLLELQYPRSARARISVKGTLRMDIAFPCCDFIELGANQPPAGVLPEKLERPLTLKEAEAHARRVLARVVGGSESERRFEVTESAEAQDDYDHFDFVEFAQSSARYPLTRVSVNLRRSNGFVQRCNWSAFRLRPKVPYEKVAEMAKAAGRTGNSNRDIMLYMTYNGGIGTLVWEYYTARRGTTSLDDTWWDAMTGELVYSKVLDGGTGRTPYNNPKYFGKVDDDQINRNVDKLIADRVAELEKKKSDEQAVPKAPAGK